MAERASGQGGTEGVALDRILRVLWDYKFLILGLAALGLAAAIAARSRIKPVYLAESKFICRANSSGARTAELGALASLVGIKGMQGGNADPSDYFADIIVDDEFLEKLFRRSWWIGGDSTTFPELWKMGTPGQDSASQYAFRKSGVGKLRNRKLVNLEKNRANNVFLLKTRFQDPSLTCQVNERIISLLNDYTRSILATKSREKRQFIETRLQEITAELQRNENALAEFREKNKEVISPRLILQQSRLHRELRVNEEIFLQLRKEYELAKIEESHDTPLIEVISKPTVPLLPDPGKKKLILPAGVALGLATGVLLSLFLGWRRGKFA